MDSKRSFLEKLVASGLDYGTISTDDVLEYADPAVLAEFLPVELKARLLQASLQAKEMTSELVVQTLGVDEMAEHLPMDVLWACVAYCVARSLGDDAAARPAPAATKKADAKKAAPVVEDKKVDAKKAAPVVEDKKANGAAEVELVETPAAPPKPNVKAKPKSDKSDSKPNLPTLGRASSLASKKRPGASSRTPPRSPTAPVTPANEFDIDTDVGDDDWGVDDIVEVVEEAAVVGAEPLDDTRLNEGLSDWKTDEETVTRGGGNG